MTESVFLPSQLNFAQRRSWKGYSSWKKNAGALAYFTFSDAEKILYGKVLLRKQYIQ